MDQQDGQRSGSGAVPASVQVRQISQRSAAALVIANIIGAGIFTTTGFLAADLGSPLAILGLWVVGGALAWCGALCYGELGAAMPSAGAEYVYLRETYGRAVGFTSAFVSFVAGFPAPIAAALESLVAYLGAFVPAFRADPLVLGPLGLNDLVALVLVWGLTAVHLRAVRGGVAFNDFVTAFKVAGIIAIIIGAVLFGTGDAANIVHSPVRPEGAGVPLTAWATSLVFVMFCYSGWNAAAYVAGEIVSPQKSLPRALLVGTAVVVVLYIGLNLVYFYGAPAEELAGKVEVGLVAARNLFGPAGVTGVVVVLSVSLLASASAMTIAGPRVYVALGRDVPALGWLARTARDGAAPRAALLAQAVVTSILVVSGRVDQILQYAGFTLALFSSLAVSCVIVLRLRRPELERPFRTWGYPLTPIVYLVVTIWMMIWALQGRPVESALAILTAVVGGLLFLALGRGGGESSA